MKQLRYAAYLRKSSEDEERQVLSINAQRDKIKERFPDLNIVKWMEPESKSAFEPDKRQVFKQLLNLFDTDEIDGVVAWHPDRLSRNEVDASAITYRIRQGIVKDLKFASFSFDNSPEGIMMLQMTMSQSQYFSAKLSKDIRRGNEAKRKLGGITGPAPEGYLNDRLKKTIHKDPIRFPLLRQAFDLFLTGEYSVPAILEIMTRDWKYLTRKKHKVGGNPLSRTSLYNIFRNPKYAGKIPNPYDPDEFHDADFPAMITPEEYDRVQLLLGRRGLPRLGNKKQFALRGFIRCGDCGCMITAQSKKKQLKSGEIKLHAYYHCTGKRGGCTQKSNYVKETDLYDQLVGLLDSYELVPELNEWAMEALHDIAQKEGIDRNSVQAMENLAIEKVQSQLDTLLDMATRKLVAEDVFKTKTKDLQAELKKLHAEQADTARRVRSWYETMIETFNLLTNANERFAEGELVDKKQILLAIGQNPVLVDRKLEITPFEWLIPVKKAAKPMRAELEKVRTMPQQMQKASLEALRTQWCWE